MSGDPLPLPPRGAGSVADSIKHHVLLLFGLLGLMWAIQILNSLHLVHLDQYGIRPRSTSGLAGIFFAPFLHAGFGHLALNSLPFVVLGGIILGGGIRAFWKVTLIVALGGGFGVWLTAARFSNHIGASGLIFGYLGFLLTRGIFANSLRWMAMALAIFFIYGGLLIGMLPLSTGISWQGHLFGFLAGIGAARMMFPTARRNAQGGRP